MSVSLLILPDMACLDREEAAIYTTNRSKYEAVGWNLWRTRPKRHPASKILRCRLQGEPLEILKLNR